MDITALNEHVPQIYADTKRKAVILRPFHLVLFHGGLPLNGAANGIDEARELDQ